MIYRLCNDVLIESMQYLPIYELIKLRKISSVYRNLIDTGIVSRLDNFSIDLMEKAQKVRKSGLTFAPEAGTQRMRDVINKNISEEDLLNAAKIAFEGGWHSVKLYFMIGLPTETDEDFQKTYDLIKDIKFNCAYIFKYSPRPGTQAAEMKDDVSQGIKEKRHSRLLNLQKKISRSLKKSIV